MPVLGTQKDEHRKCKLEGGEEKMPTHCPKPSPCRLLWVPEVHRVSGDI